ncbi:hypothetical protein GUI12_02395 [Anaplasmataceae bacterium AB001_6]|nr:hypothetical protein GUI12_02395 [Anaplasmataceae bacterium AB001_6]
MMKRISIVLFLVFAILALFIFMRVEKSTEDDIKSVETFDLYRYVGMWYVLAYPEGANIFKSDSLSYDIIDDEENCLLEKNSQGERVAKLCFVDHKMKDGSLVRRTTKNNRQYKIISIDQGYNVAIIVLNNDKNKVIILSRNNEISKEDLGNMIKPIFEELEMDVNLS